MGYIGLGGPKGYGLFFTVLIINRVSILAILVINRDGFCTHREMDIFFV